MTKPLPFAVVKEPVEIGGALLKPRMRGLTFSCVGIEQSKSPPRGRVQLSSEIKGSPVINFDASRFSVSSSPIPPFTFAIQILERGEHALIADMAASASFERFDKRSNKWITADPPILIVKAPQEHALGKLRFPILYGVITAPTMRADGSILSAPGYDAATGLLFDARGSQFPAIPERPTRGDAERALAALGSLIKGFPFVNPYDWSVALSAILVRLG